MIALWLLCGLWGVVLLLMLRDMMCDVGEVNVCYFLINVIIGPAMGPITLILAIIFYCGFIPRVLKFKLRR